jgi:endo-1,4-beta-xylanase
VILGETQSRRRAHVRATVPLILVLASIIISPVLRLSRAASEPSKQLPSNAVATPSLYKSLAEYFPVGAAVWKGDLAGPHAELLAKHFNSVVAERAMKMGPLQPTEGVFNFTDADAIVNFAKAHHMRLRGHTLVWHGATPAWLFKDASGNDLLPGLRAKALVLARVRAHIRTVLSRYKDDVYAWDVVNEVIDPNQLDGFRRSRWYELTGTEYIDTAFRVAHEVAPRAKLYINDYSTTDPVKRKFLLDLVTDLKSRGVPIDGVGHQMHINIEEPSVASIVETIDMFSAVGVDNQITELDVSVYDNSSGSCSSIPQDVLIQQSYRYRDLLDAFRRLKGKISAVTFWGLADDHTWLSKFPIERLDLPLLFDTQLEPKLAFWGIVDPVRLPALPIDSEELREFQRCSAPKPSKPKL